MYMKKFFALLLIIVVVSSPFSAQKRNGSAAAPTYGNTDGVTATQLKEHLTQRPLSVIKSEEVYRDEGD